MVRSRAAESPGHLAVPGRCRAPVIPGSAFWGWAGPVLVMLFGGYLRFYRLSVPNAVVFDETYYVTDANSILHHGVELSHVAGVNRLLLAGDPNFYQRPGGHLVGEIVAHPPLGKIVMAAGLCLGAACASKWSGVWFLLGFAGLGLAWDIGARRAAGYRDWLPTALRRDALWLPAWYGIAPLLVYTASWTGWFATSNGYFRN